MDSIRFLLHTRSSTVGSYSIGLQTFPSARFIVLINADGNYSVFLVIFLWQPSLTTDEMWLTWTVRKLHRSYDIRRRRTNSRNFESVLSAGWKRFGRIFTDEQQRLGQRGCWYVCNMHVARQSLCIVIKRACFAFCCFKPYNYVVVDYVLVCMFVSLFMRRITQKVLDESNDKWHAGRFCFFQWLINFRVSHFW